MDPEKLVQDFISAFPEVYVFLQEGLFNQKPGVAQRFQSQILELAAKTAFLLLPPDDGPVREISIKYRLERYRSGRAGRTAAYFAEQRKRLCLPGTSNGSPFFTFSDGFLFALYQIKNATVVRRRNSGPLAVLNNFTVEKVDFGPAAKLDILKH